MPGSKYKNLVDLAPDGNQNLEVVKRVSSILVNKIEYLGRNILKQTVFIIKVSVFLS